MPACLGANAVCGDVKTQQSKVGAEEVFEMRTGLHDVEEVAECLRLAKMQIEFVCPDVTVNLERRTDPARRFRGVRASLDGVWISGKRSDV
jgi:hypothetical protein